MLVAHGEHRLLERTPLHLGEKSRKFLLGCQMKPLEPRIPDRAGRCRRDAHAAGRAEATSRRLAGNYTG